MEVMRRSAEQLARVAAYLGGLARKYRHAAHYPWIYVERDPPPPQ
jgi:hypothetical protein